ncbi:hypothetical protein [Aquimarina hainanensis]
MNISFIKKQEYDAAEPPYNPLLRHNHQEEFLYKDIKIVCFLP